MTQNDVLIARYEKLSARAAQLEEALDSLASNPRKSISLDTSEGKQSTTFQDPIITQNWLDKTYEKMEYIARRLGGGMLVSLNMRRDKYSTMVFE